LTIKYPASARWWRRSTLRPSSVLACVVVVVLASTPTQKYVVSTSHVISQSFMSKNPDGGTSSILISTCTICIAHAINNCYYM
jgi:hypothetical protein